MEGQNIALGIWLVGGLALLWKTVETNSNILAVVTGVWFLGGLYLILNVFRPPRD